MFADTSNNQVKETSCGAETPAEAMKRKFRWALFLLDLSICLPLFVFFPRKYYSIHHVPFEYFMNSHQWGKLFTLFLAVFLLSLGVYKIVDIFYKWPADEK